MKYLIFMGAFLSLFAFAEEKPSTWDKTKGAINTTAEKIDSGTRKVIRKTKAKIREEQQEREDREKKKRESDKGEIHE